MQPPVTDIRSEYTPEQVEYEIRDSPSIHISAGVELLDMDLNVLEDLTDDLIDGAVSRSNYANLHGGATLALSRELAWGQAIVRPYMRLNGIRFNLGAYYTNTPDRELGTQPLVYTVQCYDLLDALNTPTGEAFAVAAGASYLTTVREILNGLGFSQLQIDSTRVSTTLPTAKVWPLDSQTTWLNIVNDLLAAIGYRGIWSDWDGYLRCEPYLTPSDRATEWVYDTTDPNSTMLSIKRIVSRDYYKAPNKWVAIRQGDIAGSTPIEGNGVYTYINEYDGLTSVESRDGRVITSVLLLDAADQSALISQTNQAIESDLRLQTKYIVESSPNPLHWHFDKLLYRDQEVGSDVAVMSTAWELPLLGGNMRHNWTEI